MKPSFALFLLAVQLLVSGPTLAQVEQRCVLMVDRFEDQTELPQFHPIFDQVMPGAGLLEFDIDTIQPSNQDGLQFSLIGAPPGMSIDRSTGWVSWLPDSLQIGTISATVVVTDPQGRRNRQTFCIEVVGATSAPRIEPIADQFILAKQPYAFTVTTTDPGPGDGIVFSLDQAPVNLGIDPISGLMEWTPDLADLGVNPVTVRATNPSGQFDLERFLLIVIIDNQPPVLAAIPDRGAAPDVPVELIAAASDPDGDVLSWSLTERPAGMTIDAGNGAIRWVPTLQQLGPHPVTVRVSDAFGLSDTASFEIAVDINRAPVAVDDRDFIVERGATLNVPAPGVLGNDFDPNNDPLTAQLVTGPGRGALTLNADGSFDYTPENPIGSIAMVEKWGRDGGGGGRSWQPLIVKLDAADPVPAIIVSTFAGCCEARIIALDGASGNVRWERIFSSREMDVIGPMAAAADIDGDGKVEILVIGGEPDFAPSAMLMIYAFEHDGGLKWISEPLPYRYFRNGSFIISQLTSAAITIADLDQDGTPEILVAAGNDHVNYHVLDHEGRKLDYVFDSATGSPLGGSATTRVEVADLTLDGKPEIIVGSAAWTADGALLWSRSGPDFGNRFNQDFPIIANLDDDPYPELVRTRGTFSATTSNSDIVALNHDGTTLWEVSRPTSSSFNDAPMVIADLDGDGLAEILIPGPQGHNVFEVRNGADGSLKWSNPAPTRQTGAAVFDLDGDGFMEVIFLDAEGRLNVWDGRDGSEKLVFELPGAPRTSGPIGTLPVFADIDNDGQAELVVVPGGSFGTTRAIQVLESPANDWPPMRDLWNQYRYHVTNINDDLSVPAVERPHWLLPGLNQSMVNERLPETRTEETDSFSYQASDGELLSNIATVEISILPPNAAPRILSTPKTLASPGFEYVYKVLAVDADPGEILSWSLPQAPAAMTVDALGVVRWTPAVADLGAHPVVIAVTDTLGISGFQNFIIEVRDPVTVPDLAGLDEAAAIAALDALSLSADPLRDVFSDTIAIGQVAGQSPVAGTSVAAGAGITVEVSRGPVPVRVPRLTGLRLDDALAALAAAGLSALPIDWVNDPAIPRGLIRQQDPSPSALVAPGGNVALVVSGGPRAVIQVDPPLIPSGGLATVTVEVRDSQGAPLDPQPAVALALQISPDAIFGSVPVLIGNTIDTGSDTQGEFAVKASFNTGSIETIEARVAVLPPISDGPGGTIYTDFTRQQVEFGHLIEALIEAIDANDGPLIEALDQALGDLVAAIDIRRLRSMTVIAPEGGVPPTPAQAIAGGLTPSPDDAAYVDIGLELVVLLEAIDQLLREGIVPDFVLNQLNQNLAAAASALAGLEPSAVGVLRAQPEIIALLGTYAPSMLEADIVAVRQALREAGVISADGRAGSGRFTLPGIMAASSIRQSIIKNFYVPYLGQVARALGTVIAAGQLQPYVNNSAIVGIISGASQSIHVFNIPNSAIEGIGFDPTMSPNNAVIMIGPNLINAAIGAASDLVSASSLKEANAAMDSINAAVGAWNEANSIPKGVFRGCILDPTPGCTQLAYPDGFASVYSIDGGLSLPAPVLIIARNLVSGGSAIFLANFVPTRED